MAKPTTPGSVKVPYLPSSANVRGEATAIRASRVTNAEALAKGLEKLEGGLAFVESRLRHLSDRVTALTGNGTPISVDVLAVTGALLQQLNMLRPVLVGFTWTDNSPVAGSVAWTAGRLYYGNAVYHIAAGNTASKFIRWSKTSSNSAFQTGASFPTLGDDEFLIATNTSGVHDLTWNALGNLSITNAYINDLSADKITAGYIQTTRLNIKQIIVDGMTLTGNSPAAGRIAWSACTVYWNGTAYAITGSNTPATTNKFVYWDAGNLTFTAADSFTPQVNRFPIATNNSGTADEAWNKLASVGIQEANLAFNILFGMQMQAWATVAGINVQTGGNGTTTVLNTSPAKGGIILAIGIRTASGISVDVGNVNLKIQVDGGTAETYTMWNAGTGTWNPPAKTIASVISGNGNAAGDVLGYETPLFFSNSILMQIVVDSVGGGGGGGSIDVTVFYATKI